MRAEQQSIDNEFSCSFELYNPRLLAGSVSRYARCLIPGNMSFLLLIIGAGDCGGGGRVNGIVEQLAFLWILTTWIIA